MSARMTLVLALDAGDDLVHGAFGWKPSRDGPWCFARLRETQKAVRAKIEAHALAPSAVVMVVAVDDGLWVLSLWHQGQWLLSERVHDCRLVDEEDLGLKQRLHGDFRTYARKVLHLKVHQAPETSFADQARTHLAADAHDLQVAIERAGIPADRRKLAEVLTGRATTRAERISPVGDLPAFLEALGITRVFPGWRDELAAEQDRMESKARDLMSSVTSAVGTHTPTPLDLRAGGVLAPVGRWLALLELAEPYGRMQVAIRMALEPARAKEVAPEVVVFQGEPWLAFEWVRDDAGSCSRLAAAFPGTAVDVFSACLHHGPAPSIRLRGTFRDGQLDVVAVHPAATAASLADAISLMDAAEGVGTFAARDRDELAAIAKAMSRYGQSHGLSQTGLTLDHADRMLLARVIFRVRHAPAWFGVGVGSDG